MNAATQSHIRALFGLFVFLVPSITPLHAQTIPDIGGLANVDQTNTIGGDLILGFNNPGVSSNLLVDVGPAFQYYTTGNALAGESPGGSSTVSSTPLTPGVGYLVEANNPNDLATVFGSSQYSATTSWAVVGGNAADLGPGAEPANTLWLTGSGLTAQNTAGQNTLSSGLDTLTASMIGASPVGGGSLDAGAFSTSPGTSFKNQMGAGTFAFGEGPLIGNTLALGSGGSSTLELYELLPTDTSHSGPATVDLGFFTLNSTGLYFNIPEPSTYAAILGTAALGFAVTHRKRALALGR